MAEYNIPETLEELKARKEELVNKINEYNTSFFNGATPPYTEEEVDSFQDELTFLEDNFYVSRDTDKKELTIEDKKQRKNDILSILIYLYTFIAIVAGLWIIVEYIGRKFLYNYIVELENSEIFQAYGSLDVYVTNNESLFIFRVCLSYAIYPLIIIVLSTVLKIIFGRKKEVRISSLICLLIIIAECIASFLINILPLVC